MFANRKWLTPLEVKESSRADAGALANRNTS
jgi:hypothetical protein